MRPMLWSDNPALESEVKDGAGLVADVVSA
jgi:hypothetical protein